MDDSFKSSFLHFFFVSLFFCLKLQLIERMKNNNQMNKNKMKDKKGFFFWENFDQKKNKTSDSIYCFFCVSEKKTFFDFFGTFFIAASARFCCNISHR